MNSSATAGVSSRTASATDVLPLAAAMAEAVGRCPGLRVGSPRAEVEDRRGKTSINAGIFPDRLETDLGCALGNHSQPDVVTGRLGIVCSATPVYR